MPETPAPITPTAPEMVKPEIVGLNLKPPIEGIKEQVKNAGIDPNQVDYGRHDQPVPTEIFGDINKKPAPTSSKSQPGTYEDDTSMAMHLIPEIPGLNLHLPTRTGKSGPIKSLQEARNAQVKAHNNQGSSNPKAVMARIGDWFMEEKKAA